MIKGHFYRRLAAEIYADLLDDGSRLLYAYSISPNGRYIVGFGYDGSRESSSANYLIDTW